MAAITLTGSTHKTLGAGTADTVTIASAGSKLEIVNRSTTDPIYVAFGGTAAVAGADGTTVIPAGESKVFLSGGPNSVISVISAGAAPYSIQSFSGL